MEHADGSGGGVMSNAKEKPDKGAGKDMKPEKPVEYRRFEEVLKKVIKAPPLKKSRA